MSLLSKLLPRESNESTGKPEQMTQNTDTLAEPQQTPEMARTQALIEMKAAIRQLRRDVDRREDELDERRERAKGFLREGRDSRADEEMELYLHDETVMTDLRMILGGQERALSTARAHSSYQQFAAALDAFSKIAQTSAHPATDVELEITRLSEQLRDAAEAYGDVETDRRRARRHNPALESLREELEYEIASEAAGTNADLVPGLTDRELEQRMQVIQQRRAELDQARGAK